MRNRAGSLCPEMYCKKKNGGNPLQSHLQKLSPKIGVHMGEKNLRGSSLTNFYRKNQHSCWNGSLPEKKEPCPYYYRPEKTKPTPNITHRDRRMETWQFPPRGRRTGIWQQSEASLSYGRKQIREAWIRAAAPCSRAITSSPSRTGSGS